MAAAETLTQSMLAQRSALGKGIKILRPERASQEICIVLFSPFRADVLVVIDRSALRWAEM
jgi:hypothetical protein